MDFEKEVFRLLISSLYPVNTNVFVRIQGKYAAIDLKLMAKQML